MNDDIDDGSDRPLGHQTPDGELEVRDNGDGTRGYHETQLGQHQRWIRQAPELFEKYDEQLRRIRELEAQLTTRTHELHEQDAVATALMAELARLTHERDEVNRFVKLAQETWRKDVFRADKAEADVLRLRTALRSIANSSCCSGCQEAALVAKAALADPLPAVASSGETKAP